MLNECGGVFQTAQVRLDADDAQRAIDDRNVVRGSRQVVTCKGEQVGSVIARSQLIACRETLSAGREREPDRAETREVIDGPRPPVGYAVGSR